jgi:hypothetical protein
MTEAHVQKLLAWTQLVTAIAALATAILVGYYSHQQISIYNRQLDTYRGQLAELHVQNQQLAAQTVNNEAATLARVFHTSTGSHDYHVALEAAQRLTFDVAAADALKPYPGQTPLVNPAAIRALSTELEARLVEQLLTAATQFRTQKTANCRSSARAYSPDDLKRIRREFLATYLLVHPAAGGEKSLDAPWDVEKRKHITGPPGVHRETFLHFAALVDQITTPCTANK